MRAFTSTLLAFCAIVFAMPQVTPPSPAVGGGSGAQTTGSGIPNVTNAQNPTCIPYYGVRDAIMGGIFQGLELDFG
jgi:hypothetical protein